MGETTQRERGKLMENALLKGVAMADLILCWIFHFSPFIIIGAALVTTIVLNLIWNSR